MTARAERQQLGLDLAALHELVEAGDGLPPDVHLTAAHRVFQGGVLGVERGHVRSGAAGARCRDTAERTPAMPRAQSSCAARYTERPSAASRSATVVTGRSHARPRHTYAASTPTHSRPVDQQLRGIRRAADHHRAARRQPARGGQQLGVRRIAGDGDLDRAAHRGLGDGQPVPARTRCPGQQNRRACQGRRPRRRRTAARGQPRPDALPAAALRRSATLPTGSPRRSDRTAAAPAARRHRRRRTSGPHGRDRRNGRAPDRAARPRRPATPAPLSPDTASTARSPAPHGPRESPRCRRPRRRGWTAEAGRRPGAGQGSAVRNALPR